MNFISFKSGNFNDIEQFIKIDLPTLFNSIKNELLPKISIVFNNMLDSVNGVVGNNIDSKFIIKDGNIIGLNVELNYTVDDFKTDITIPKDAIEIDENSIKEYLNANSVTINTSTGEVIINIDVVFNDNEV